MDKSTPPSQRAEPIELPPASDPRRPFRLWMTGSFAVVMAALAPVRSVPAFEFEPGRQVVRHSRFSVSETVERLQAAACDQGLSVLALVSGVRPVLVLASSAGGTLVVMHRADSAPEMPFSMVVRESPSGGSDVLVVTLSADRDSRDSRAWRELPAGVADDLHALPSVVDRALA